MTTKYDVYIDHINNTMSIRTLEIALDDEWLINNLSKKTSKGEQYWADDIYMIQKKKLLQPI